MLFHQRMTNNNQKKNCEPQLGAYMSEFTPVSEKVVSLHLQVRGRY